VARRSRNGPVPRGRARPHRAGTRHAGGVRVAAVSAAANAPAVSERHLLVAGAHFRSSFAVNTHRAFESASPAFPRDCAPCRTSQIRSGIFVCFCLVLAPWRRSRGILGLDTGAEQQQPGLGLLLPRAAPHHSSPARNKVQVRTPQVRPWRQRAHTF
jgi:hypothetical protein